MGRGATGRGELIMHNLLLVNLIHSVQKRVKQGDCPTETPQSVETLEEMVVELWDRLQRAKLKLGILTDPDDDPQIGDEQRPATTKGELR